MGKGFSERFHEQLMLIPYENPLLSRMSKEFWDSLPKAPGVYIMIGLAGSILYVGKAKNLRARLASYRRAKPNQVSRKVIRLIHVVDEIRFETCESEAGALLRENELLRLHKPVFNVMNTHPESYYFIGIRERSGVVPSLEFRLTTHPEFRQDGWKREDFFGAFKGRGSLRDAYQALLRLLWASQSESERFEYPLPLSSKKIPYRFELPFGKNTPEKNRRDLASQIRRFFKGNSSGILKLLTEVILTKSNLPPFYYRGVQEDLERLQSFFAYTTNRNYRIRRELGLSDHLIPQDRIDDFIVLYKEKKNQRF